MVTGRERQHQIIFQPCSVYVYGRGDVLQKMSLMFNKASPNNYIGNVTPDPEKAMLSFCNLSSSMESGATLYNLESHRTMNMTFHNDDNKLF